MRGRLEGVPHSDKFAKLGEIYAALREACRAAWASFQGTSWENAEAGSIFGCTFWLGLSTGDEDINSKERPVENEVLAFLREFQRKAGDVCQDQFEEPRTLKTSHQLPTRGSALAAWRG
ncbi:hypothetical protein ACJ72_01210 [Emergomyces africanus]|uniref:Uncharacterized protein n=1 Tax=Emergomyces africanus TaxID=1955775 RepID=A0A1B7P5Y0_9EURO|nr:hypothetical protein ACJ72_01210 [Emergomyces africanus]